MRHFVVVVVVDPFVVVVVAQLEGIYIVVVVGPTNFATTDLGSMKYFRG